jgi:hypothetical protein
MNELDNLHEDPHLNVDEGKHYFSNILRKLKNIGILKYKLPYR